MSDPELIRRHFIVEGTPEGVEGLTVVLGKFAAVNGLHVWDDAKAEQEELWARHIRATYPQAATDYLGKEHLWVLGEEVGIERRYSADLFREICFPIKGDLRCRNEIIPVAPESIGLTIKKRHEVGMPPPPIYIVTNGSTKAMKAHGVGYSTTAARNALTDRVIQIQSLIVFGRSPEETDADFTPRSLNFLARIMPRLLELSED